MESAKKSNKIREIVRLQQILKKWKKIAAASSNSNSNTCPPEAASASKTKTISPAKFLKKTLSFSNSSSLTDTTSDQEVPKGYLAVCVGRDPTEEMKRFVIPTDYLTHKAFGILLREAEEEFGFQQEGILRIPCDVPVFENILKTMHHRNSSTKRLSSSASSSSSSLHDHHHHHHHHNHGEEEITIVGSTNGFCSSYSPPPPHSDRPSSSSSSSSAPHSSPHLQLCR